MSLKRLQRTRDAYPDQVGDPTFRAVPEIPNHVKEWVNKAIQEALKDHKDYYHPRPMR